MPAYNENNLQNVVRQHIEKEISEGRLKPGDRVGEAELMERFGSSRTPVRQALLQLGTAGLLEMRPRLGAFVAAIPVARLVAMWEVLTELEGLAARLASTRMTPEERDALTSVLERSRAHAQSGDYPKYYELNRELHEIIYAGSRNEFLAEHIRNIRDRLRVYRPFPFQLQSQLHQSLIEHEKIVDAVLTGCADKADEIMQHHISRGGKAYTELIFTSGST